MNAHRITGVLAALCLAAGVSRAQLPDWQVDQPGSGLVVNGVVASPFQPALTTACTGSIAQVTFSSTNVGQIWDVAIGTLPIVARTQPGSLTTPGQQIVNVDVTDPTLSFLFGGPVLGATPFPGTLTVGATMPGVPLTISAQQIVFGPGTSDGFALSQATQIDVQPNVGSIPGPFDDDGLLYLRLAAPPLCGPTSVPFYGVSYTELFVMANGRIQFSNPFTGNPATYSPFTLGLALTDDPFFGAWADFDVSSGGSITTTVPTPGTIRVAFSNVPFFASVGVSTFALQIDSSGTIILDGLLGIGISPTPMFLGISAGIGGATDPGPTTFAVSGGPVPGPAGLGMIYRYGTSGSLAPGVNQIIFVPQSSGNYSWIGL